MNFNNKSESIYDIVKEYGYPVFFGFPAGHIPENNAFYIGRQSRIDVADNKAALSFI